MYISNALLRSNAGSAADPDHIDALVPEIRNCIANALEIRLSCTKPSIYIFCQESASALHTKLIASRGNWWYVFNWHQHIEAATKWPPFSIRHFQMHFREWKYWNFVYYFTENRRSGDKPLSEPMIVNLLKHIWVTRPQWVKTAEIQAPPTSVWKDLCRNINFALTGFELNWLIFHTNIRVWLRTTWVDKMRISNGLCIRNCRNMIMVSHRKVETPAYGQHLQ